MKFLLPIIISNRYCNLKKITLEGGRDREGEWECCLWLVQSFNAHTNQNWVRWKLEAKTSILVSCVDSKDPTCESSLA